MAALAKKQHQQNKYRKRNFYLIQMFPIFIIALANTMDSPQNIFDGFRKMIFSSDILITDYVELAGLSATLINASLLFMAISFLAYRLQIKLNGMLIAAIFMTVGFSFFGKNIFNVIPLYLGGYIYSKIQKVDFKNIFVIIIFSSALAPVVSEIAFGLSLPLYYSIPASILFGAFCGFIITPLSANTIAIHDGFNLYNVGFSAGLIALVINSIFKTLGINLKPSQILSTEHSLFFFVMLCLLFTLFIVVGFTLSKLSFKETLKKYTRIFHYSGKLITDFTQLEGYGITYINMGIMGFIALLFVCLTGGLDSLNGPIVGAIFSIFGFSAFGNHPKNSIPIFVGVYLCSLLHLWDANSTTYIVAGLFATALAPIAGRYGIIAGLFVSFLHLAVVTNLHTVHGGLNLYSNGFSCGLIASIVYPIFHIFSPSHKKRKV